MDIIALFNYSHFLIIIYVDSWGRFDVNEPSQPKYFCTNIITYNYIETY